MLSLHKKIEFFQIAISRQRRRGRAQAGSLALLLALTGLFGVAAPIGSARPAMASGNGCAPASTPQGPFWLQPNQTPIRFNDHFGNKFISYGTTSAELDTSTNPPTAPKPEDVGTTNPPSPGRIGETAAWCGNTMRLQLGQWDVFGSYKNLEGKLACNVPYLVGAVLPEINAALADHLIVVINDNSESDLDQSGNRGPTFDTVQFWNCLARPGTDFNGQMWPGLAQTCEPSTCQWPGPGESCWSIDQSHPAPCAQSNIIFDVFNEPNPTACHTDTPTYSGTGSDISVWLNGDGSTYQGEQHLGMQDIVDYIRGLGARNLLWVEGTCTAGTLANIAPQAGCTKDCPPNSLISDPLNRVVYSIHHPAGTDSAAWYTEFGYLINLPGFGGINGIAPVVDGEWYNGPRNSYCWATAEPQTAQDFMGSATSAGYLEKLGVGLSAYALRVGYLLQQDGTTPTDYTNWLAGSSCGSGDTALGPGAAIRAWFQKVN